MASRGDWRELRERVCEIELPTRHLENTVAMADFRRLTSKHEKKIKDPDFSAPSQMVTFIIGRAPDQETFLVHKEHACRYSPVLDKAFNSTFKEGETQTYTMDDATVEAFRMFVPWIYSQKFNVSVHNGDTSLAPQQLRNDSSNHMSACKKETNNLLQLWVLAEKLMVSPLQDVVMNQFNIIRQTCAGAFEIQLNYIYANTSEESLLRHFAVQIVAWSPQMDYKKLTVLYPKEFLLDLVTVFHTAVPARTQTKKMDSLDISEYYATKEE